MFVQDSTFTLKSGCQAVLTVLHSLFRNMQFHVAMKTHGTARERTFVIDYGLFNLTLRISYVKET